MAAPLKRVPPPPPITADPMFNRWLHDLTAFISESGGIDVSQISGFSALSATVATHTSQISLLNSEVATNTTNIATNTTNIAVNASAIATANANIATLTARSRVLNGSGAPSGGNSGDWFADVTNKHIYVNVSGTWVLIV